ncbi:MAG TPA: hypothetical protein PKA19_03375 [Bacillota bacterium]|nr:hypothetical protein [Bacillota bacterium]
MLSTRNVILRDDAIEKKLDSLRVKILGFELGKFEVGEMRDVYVPYSLMTYGFLIDRKTMFNRNGHLNRSGELHFVFDYNEVHPFQYYTEENGELDLIKVDEARSDRLILPSNATAREVQDKMEWHIQTKVLRRTYATGGKITLKAEKKFYRAAVEIKIYYGANENIRYAYLDEYGVNSEHILGLKYRISS